MRDALRKKAGLEIVDSRSGADVLVEVLGREEREGSEGGFGGAALTKMGQMIIRLHVTSGPPRQRRDRAEGDRPGDVGARREGRRRTAW
jgi:hypothetical protein